MRSTQHFQHFATQASTPAPMGGVVVPRRTLIGLATLGALGLVWGGAATIYLAARGELGPGLFALETEMKFAYEDRIGRLGAQLEREITQNLVERTSFDARVGALAAKQAEIEVRQRWLRSVAERVSGVEATGGLGLPAEARMDKVAPGSGAPKPAPLADEDAFKLRDASSPSLGTSPQPLPRDRLSAIEMSLERVSSEELRVLKDLGRGTRLRLSRLRSAIDATGIDLGRGKANATGIGGPFVSAATSPNAAQFGFLTEDLDLSFSELSRLQNAARTLPLGSPLVGEAEQTSAFGYRVDPFTRGAAMHTGVDFRAETGASARSTGAGTIVSAEYSGGYGLMVEIDHGGGLSTRYGHLSAFAVVAGERVERGQIIGRTGSTGRSTGPHLHYETRINGDAVNPTRFLSAGRLLAARGG